MHSNSRAAHRARQVSKDVNKSNSPLVFFALAVIFVAGCSDGQSVHKMTTPVRLGACPTMSRHYLPDSADSYEVVHFRSTMNVMAALQAEEIDIGFVGRPARESEGGGELSGFPLRSGWTLVGRSSRMIDESALERAIAHTIADSLTLSRYLPLTVTVRPHGSVSAALDSCGLNDVVFLSWDDYRETYPLVIASKGDGKIPRFRRPTLYCRKNDEKSYQSIIKRLRDYVSEKEEG